jgi:hypothetical protein
VLSSAAGLWKLFRDQAERGSGISLKLFGFTAESVFTIIPEPCSGSPRNAVRNHPGIAFTLDRIPHLTVNLPEQAPRSCAGPLWRSLLYCDPRILTEDPIDTNAKLDG